MERKIFFESDLIAILAAAKAGGQFVTIYAETDVKLNKFPTDGSEKIRIDSNFVPRHAFSVTFNFAEDYEKAMAKAMGVDSYEAHDSNRRHLIKNVVVEYISTGNKCLIYIVKNYKNLGYSLNGREMTAEEIAYMDRYKSKSKDSGLVPYRNVGLKNVKRIAIGGEVYVTAFGAEEIPLVG